MRVFHAEVGFPAPCSSFTFGAVLDFTVVIGSGNDTGTSGGTVFLIILMVLIPVYIAGGCIFMRKKRGTVTMKESCPHYEFWSAIPGLVKDGCIFSAKKTKVLYQRCFVGGGDHDDNESTTTGLQ